MYEDLRMSHNEPLLEEPPKSNHAETIKNDYNIDV
jgi:hypothetical protein